MDKSRASDASMVAIECVGGGSKAEEWGPEIVQTGDIVEEIRMGGGSPAVRAPFKGGKSAVQKMLHAAFKRGDTSIQVRARRGATGMERERKDLTGCVVPSGKKSYVVRSIHDPNYMVGFVDRTESECIALQASRTTRAVSALKSSQVHDGFIQYPWEDKKAKASSLPNYKNTLDGGSFLSILILPKALESNSSRYDTLEETMGRAHAWILSSRKSGVPVSFVNLQTEGLLTKISGETASATVNGINDLADIINLSVYGFEDYHGVDLGVVKAIRLWYRAVRGEIAIQINLHPNDNRLGFAVSRTDEGFIYISSVEEDSIHGDDAPSTRCGLRDLYRKAKSASKLLIISRIAHEKVLPWMISPNGAIRCFDTISLSQKLSLFRQALVPFSIHVLLWDTRANGGAIRRGQVAASASEAEAVERVSRDERNDMNNNNSNNNDDDNNNMNNNMVIGDEVVNVERESIGDVSFRIDDVLLPTSWV